MGDSPFSLYDYEQNLIDFLRLNKNEIDLMFDA